MWQGCWPIYLLIWDAESCWWGRSLVLKTTDRGCFQQWGDPSILAGELHLTLCKGKGKALDHDNHCGFKLTDNVKRLLEWVLDFYFCEMVNMDEMQCSFVSGRCTTDTIFVVPQLQEKYIAVNKWLYFAFLIERKPLIVYQILWQALRSLCVKEWTTHVIQSM